MSEFHRIVTYLYLYENNEKPATWVMLKSKTKTRNAV